MIWDRGGLESYHRWSSIIYHTWSDIICGQMSAITSLVSKLFPQVICGTMGDRGGQASYTRSHTHYCMSKCHTPLHGQLSHAITSLIPRLFLQKCGEERAWERGCAIIRMVKHQVLTIPATSGWHVFGACSSSPWTSCRFS